VVPRAAQEAEINEAQAGDSSDDQPLGDDAAGGGRPGRANTLMSATAATIAEAAPPFIPTGTLPQSNGGA